MKKEKAFAALCGCLGVFLLSAGTTNAFLQRTTGQLDNEVTPGSIEAAMTESLWKEEDARDLSPGRTIAKNPSVTNTGENPSWVFLRVDVPVKRIIVVDQETKRKGEKKEVPLLTFQAEGSWSLVEEKREEGKISYVYGYQDILSPGESTPALFQEATLANYLEGELDPEEAFEMPVGAASIQSNVEGGDPQSVYQEYLSQEAADGKE